MPGIDDRLRRDLEHLAGRGDPAGAFDRVSARRRRRGLVRRAQVAGLVVAVLAATAGGTWALARAFRFREQPAPAAPQLPLTGNGKIAFVSDQDGNQEIYTMNPDGTGVTRLTDHPAADVWPAWSPDGKKIAFARATEADSDLYVMNADGSGLTNLTKTPGTSEGGGPAWSPDGSRIAYVGNGAGSFDVWVMAADGHDARHVSGIPVGVQHPVWSPDGTEIAFNASLALGPGAIYVVNVDGTDQRQVFVDEQAYLLLRAGSWSPDGTRLLFTRSTNGGKSSDVYAIGRDGAGLARLTRDRLSGDPAWSPDGSRIAFTGFRRNSGMVFVMNPDGSEQQLLADVSAVGFGLSWQPVQAAPVSPEPSATAPTVSPSEIPPEGFEAAFGPLCGVSGIGGDFDGDRNPDVALAAYARTGESCPQEPPENEWKVYVLWGNGAGGAWPLTECGRACRAFASHDIDGNGTDEFFLAVDEGASTEFLQVYELTVDERPKVPFEVAAPGAEGHPANEPILLPYGGSVTHYDFVTCDQTELGHLLVATSVELDQQQSEWNIHETVFEFDGAIFMVLSTDDSQVAFDPSEAEPPPTEGNSCFALD